MRQPGDKVGHYVLRALLGRGGMGEVYEAEDTRLGRRVALKLIPSNADADASERMMREARAAAAFEHPNVVMVFDVGVVAPEEGAGAGQTYLAMELVRGRTLRAIVREDTIAVGRKLRWLVDVARALAAGHAAGLVHRDIKPDNLMVREDGVIKVLDFGIAKRSHIVDPSAPTEALGSNETLTKAGVIVGTPRYASPEQLRGEPLDGRADQYSWGVTAFEILTGRPPFDAEDLVALLGRVLSTEPPTLRSIDGTIDPDVEATVLKSIAKKPDDRFDSLDDAADALEPFADAAFASSDRTTRRSVDAITPALSKKKTDKEKAPASVVTRAAKTSARVFFWIAATIGTIIIVALTWGAIAGKLHLDLPSRASASASAAATAPGVRETSIRCSDAKVTGDNVSPELAHMIGIGACARLAIATGRQWSHEKAIDAGCDPAKSIPLEVEATFGETTHINLKLGAFEECADSSSPVEAMQKAIAALAPRIGTPPVSDAERADWGASSPEGARRIERVWRALLVGDLKDPETDARELAKTDGDSPWPHAILGLVALRGSKTSMEALTTAEEHLDRLSGARKKGLGALVRLLSKPNPDEAMRELRQAYDDAPNDADIAGLYAAIAISLVPTEEGFSVVDRLAQRFPTRAILALENAVTAAPRAELDRDGRYLTRLTEIVPDSACGSLVLGLRLRHADLEGGRALIATCKRYYGSASDEFGVDLREAGLDLFAGQPDQAHDIAAKRLGDPRPAVRAEAAQIVISAYLGSGRIAEASEMMRAELRRSRDEESSFVAMRHAQAILRLNRRLGTKPPDDVVRWLSETLPKNPALPEHSKLSLSVDLALANPADTAGADRVLAAYDKVADPLTSLSSLPLVRARHGDKAAVELFRNSTRAGDGPHLLVAVDAALALSALKAPPSEIEQALSQLNAPDAFGGLSLDRVIANLLHSRALADAGKQEEADAAKAKFDKALAFADPGLREKLLKLK